VQHNRELWWKSMSTDVIPRSVIENSLPCVLYCTAQTIRTNFNQKTTSSSSKTKSCNNLHLLIWTFKQNNKNWMMDAFATYNIKHSQQFSPMTSKLTANTEMVTWNILSAFRWPSKSWQYSNPVIVILVSRTRNLVKLYWRIGTHMTVILTTIWKPTKSSRYT